VSSVSSDDDPPSLIDDMRYTSDTVDYYRSIGFPIRDDQIIQVDEKGSENDPTAPDAFYLATRWNNHPITVNGERRWKIYYHFQAENFFTTGVHEEWMRKEIRDSLQYIMG